MRKNLSELIDELSIVNIKIYMLVDKIQQNKHTREEAKKLQDLNSYRSKLKNAINAEFNQPQEVKL